MVGQKRQSVKMASAFIEEAKDEFVKRLREEASHAKQCFTQYTFQALAFSAAVIGYILNNTKDNAISSVAIIPTTLLLIIMSWIGIYKYTAASRSYGYQLYIEKMNGLSRKKNPTQTEREYLNAWNCILKNNHWEYTFRVLRVVEPSIFNNIYNCPTMNEGRHILRGFIIATVSTFVSFISLVMVFIQSDKKYQNLSLIQSMDIIWGKYWIQIIIYVIVVLFVVGILAHKNNKLLYRALDTKIYSLNKDAEQFKNNYIDGIVRDDKFIWYLSQTIFEPKRKYGNLVGNFDGEANKNYQNKLKTVYFYSGTYLKNMLNLLGLMQHLSLLPLMLAFVFLSRDLILSNIFMPMKFLELMIVLCCLLVLFCIVQAQRVQINRRREIIDNELHSISSFSKIWQFVSLIHYNAFMNSCDAEKSVLDDSNYAKEVVVGTTELMIKLF